VEADDPHTAMVWSLIYLFDCYCEETGKYQVPNLGVPKVESDDSLHTAPMVRSLIYLFDCYCEETGEYQVPNLARVELHARLWIMSCAGNSAGEKDYN
jgi:hypothetical protein